MVEELLHLAGLDHCPPHLLVSLLSVDLPHLLHPLSASLQIGPQRSRARGGEVYLSWYYECDVSASIGSFTRSHSRFKIFRERAITSIRRPGNSSVFAFSSSVTILRISFSRR